MADLVNESFISRLIKALPDGKPTSNRSHYVIRCPFCGDSVHRDSRHLYIALDPPFGYNCKLCEEGGYLNNKTLRNFDIYDGGLIIDLMTIMKDYKVEFKRKHLVKRKDYKFNTVLNKTVEDGLRYFNSRFGLNYTTDDIRYLEKVYGLVLDVNNFISVNNIKLNKELMEKMEKMEKKFNLNMSIGFLSANRTYLICRTYDPNAGKMRYNNLVISGNKENNDKETSLATEVDILTEKLNLVITEGVFDIIGVYEAFYKDIADESYAFVASCGKSFNKTIKRYSQMGFLDLDVTIYSDAEVEVGFYKNMLKHNKYVNSITLMYNTLGKDCGVPKSQISLRKAVVRKG